MHYPSSVSSPLLPHFAHRDPEACNQIQTISSYHPPLATALQTAAALEDIRSSNRRLAASNMSRQDTITEVGGTLCVWGGGGGPERKAGWEGDKGRRWEGRPEKAGRKAA
jgi:hypothetical protein